MISQIRVEPFFNLFSTYLDWIHPSVPLLFRGNYSLSPKLLVSLISGLSVWFSHEAEKLGGMGNPNILGVGQTQG